MWYSLGRLKILLGNRRSQWRDTIFLTKSDAILSSVILRNTQTQGPPTGRTKGWPQKLLGSTSEMPQEIPYSPPASFL